MYFKKYLILTSIILFISCEKNITKSDMNSDDELIQKIIDAEKIDIDIIDLPSLSRTTINQDYNDYIEYNVQMATDLGYQVSMDGRDYKPGDRNELYFNLKGKKLISKRDKNGKYGFKCFELVLPIAFDMPDGSSMIVDDEKGYIEIRDWYKENVDVLEKPKLQYPVSIIYKDGETLMLNNEEEMKRTKLECRKWDDEKKSWDCFKLVYPITYIMQDGSAISMSDDEDWSELKSWYDNNSDVKERPLLGYPVNIIYQDGVIQTINSNEEMRVIKEECGG